MLMGSAVVRIGLRCRSAQSGWAAQHHSHVLSSYMTTVLAVRPSKERRFVTLTLLMRMLLHVPGRHHSRLSESCYRAAWKLS